MGRSLTPPTDAGDIMLSPTAFSPGGCRTDWPARQPESDLWLERWK
ncbi:MAG: hypothetical protein ACK4SN_06630 [Bellilinea sp.]